MKKLLVIAMLFISIIANSQQISELSKGLLFRWTGNEWDGNRDLISGSIGQSTDTYNVMDKSANGRRELQYNGTSSYTALPTIPAFGTGDFTVIGLVNSKNISNPNSLFGGMANSFALYIYTGNIAVRKTESTQLTLNYSFTVNTDYIIGYTRSGTTGTFYINGVSIGTISDALDYSVASTFIGRYETSAYFMNGSISMCRIFNYAVDATTVRADGLTDLQYYSKPENPIKAIHIGSGAAKNVLNLNAEGMGKSDYTTRDATKWSDFTNSLTATNSGTTLVIPPASNLKGTYFNGTTSSLIFPTTINTNIFDNGSTISMWFNTLEDSAMICTKSQWYIRVSSTYVKFLQVFSTTVGIFDVPGINLNVWNNVIINYNSSSASNIPRIWVNGVKQTVTVSTAPVGIRITDSSNAFEIGSLNTNAYNSKSICNVNIWNLLLDSDLCKLLYDTGF